ncbi:MAG: phage tail tape measure protein [Actinobacteria bacterium]|nr:phage tail tape measure protein [Actinomycetota bacterium]
MADRTLRVVFAGDAKGAIAASRGVQTGLARLSESMRSVGQKMTAVGSRLTRSITLPIVALGGAAVKSAVDFETAFTRIDAVSNATQEQMESWKKSVLSLSGSTARAPEELADALYFLASAGLKADQIIPTLEMSAKAASIGLGQTADIARLTANVLNAYSSEGMTAARATDILIAAVKEGTAEPEEFANALGRILPVAAKAKVSFDQVAGSLAVLSNIGLDVNEGTTAMRGLLQALVAPTTQTKTALDELGISTTELRDRIEKRGVLDALRFLDKAADGNIETLRNIIPNVRALTAVFGLTEQEAQKVTDSFDAVKNSTGELDEAFGKTTKSSAFKFQQLLAKLKKLGIELGNALLPVARDITKSLGELADRFSNLSPEVQGTIIKVAGLAAALGPVLYLVGNVTKLAGGLTGAFKKGALAVRGLTGAIQLMPAALNPAGAAIAVVAAGLLQWKVRSDDVKRAVEEMSDALLTGTKTVEDYNDEFRTWLEHIDESPWALRLAKEGEDRLADAVKVVTADLNGQLKALETLPGALDEGKRKTVAGMIANEQFAQALEIMTAWEEDALDALRKRGDEMERASHETERLMNATERALKTEKAAHDDLLASLAREDEKLVELAASWTNYINSMMTGPGDTTPVGPPRGNRGGSGGGASTVNYNVTVQPSPGVSAREIEYAVNRALQQADRHRSRVERTSWAVG